jgi:hypothetical protein
MRGLDGADGRLRMTEDDVEAVAEAIELVVVNSSEHYARAAIIALIERGWTPPDKTGD